MREGGRKESKTLFVYGFLGGKEFIERTRRRKRGREEESTT